MATAGVRLLQQDVQDTLMKTTCQYIKDTTNFFISNCDNHIRAIPGELEGAYGWVAINYLMGGFDQNTKSSILNQQHTFGFLDMGGASAQIAFEPEHHQKEEHGNDLTKIHLRTLDGRALDYDVFVTTFLGYGSNEARRRYLEHRVKTIFDQHQLNKDEEGKKDKKQMDLLDDKHRLPIDDPCLPLNLEITDSHSTSITLQLKGTGQFNQCLDLTLPLLNKDAACPTQPCLFDGIHTPKIDWSIHHFVGISEYWYSSHDVLDLGGVYDFVEYEKKATEFCSKDWDLEVKEHSDWSPVEIQRYQLQCFKSAWIVNVLHSGIEVPRLIDDNGNDHHDASQLTTTINSDGTTTMIEKWKEQSIESVEDKNWNPPFQSIDTINDIQVSWTLGAMLLHVANQIPLMENEDGTIGHGSGHNSDDEGPHPIADGIELPPLDNSHPHTHPTINTDNNDSHHIINNNNNNHNWQSTPEDSNYINSSWWDLGNTVSVIGLFGMLFVLFGVVLWEWYRQTKKRRRNDYRRVDTNGGILGNLPTVSSSSTSNPSTSSLLSGPLNLMKSIAISPMVFFKYWASRIIPFRSGSSSMNHHHHHLPISSSSSDLIYQVDMNNINNNNLEQLEMNISNTNNNTLNNNNINNVNNNNFNNNFNNNNNNDNYDINNNNNNNNNGIDNMTLPIYGQQLAQQQQQQLNGALGMSNKSSSMISMKYWQKKRYSGDSHHISQIMQPGYNHHGSNINNNNSNNNENGLFRNVATSAVGLPSRANSASNLIARTGSPSIASDIQTNTSMTRSRSRVGFTIQESLEEDDYITYSGGGGGGNSENNTTILMNNVTTNSDLHRFTSISRTPSPSIAMNNFSRRSTNSAATSPKGSPRNSLERM
ncbi:unnamed protein product [Cunninghamella blakesleeana]